MAARVAGLPGTWRRFPPDLAVLAATAPEQNSPPAARAGAWAALPVAASAFGEGVVRRGPPSPLAPGPRRADAALLQCRVPDRMHRLRAHVMRVPPAPRGLGGNSATARSVLSSDGGRHRRQAVVAAERDSQRGCSRWSATHRDAVAQSPLLEQARFAQFHRRSHFRSRHTPAPANYPLLCSAARAESGRNSCLYQPIGGYESPATILTRAGSGQGLSLMNMLPSPP